MSPSRVPRGVPTGGQFAEIARGESDVDLSEGSDELTPEEMIYHARKSASHHMKSIGPMATVAVEDVAQEAMYAALKARANDPSIIITPAYLHSVARAQATVVRRGALSQRDYKAAGMLSEYLRAARERGIEPSSQEIADKAHEIWESTPPRQRPSVNFAEIMAFSEIPLDATVDAEAAGADLSSTDWSAPVVAGLSVVDSDKPTRRELDAVRSDVWSFLGSDDSPRPIPDAMSWKRTGTVKQLVEDEGGVLRVVENWTAGQRTPAGRAVLSLFTPAQPALPYVPSEPELPRGYDKLSAEDKLAADKELTSARKARDRAIRRRQRVEDKRLHAEERLADEVFPTFLRHPDYAERLLAAALSTARR